MHSNPSSFRLQACNLSFQYTFTCYTTSLRVEDSKFVEILYTNDFTHHSFIPFFLNYMCPGHDIKLHPHFIFTGSFLYWCVMRPASQFFTHNCIHLRILFISNLVTFFGTNSLSVLMCRKAVKIDYQLINQSNPQLHKTHSIFWLVCIQTLGPFICR